MRCGRPPMGHRRRRRVPAAESASSSPAGSADGPATTTPTPQEIPMDTFTTIKPPRLSIDVKAGTVSIETVDGADTTVEITPLDDHDITLDALLATTVDQHG